MLIVAISSCNVQGAASGRRRNLRAIRFQVRSAAELRGRLCQKTVSREWIAAAQEKGDSPEDEMSGTDLLGRFSVAQGPVSRFTEHPRAKARTRKAVQLVCEAETPIRDGDLGF